MSAQASPERDIVSWDDLERLVANLAGRLVGTDFDAMLCITRGGLVPAGMLAYRLRIRNILVAAVAFYDDEGVPGPHPTFLQFPADPLLRGQRVLIVDEVWESGTTIHAVTERVSRRVAFRRRSSCTTSPGSRVSRASLTSTAPRPITGSSTRSRPATRIERTPP